MSKPDPAKPNVASRRRLILIILEESPDPDGVPLAVRLRKLLKTAGRNLYLNNRCTTWLDTPLEALQMLWNDLDAHQRQDFLDWTAPSSNQP